jgi:ABC-type transporter Mla MlaB component
LTTRLDKPGSGTKAQDSMEARYSIKPEQHPSSRTVTLWLNGKMSEDALPVLDRFVSEARESKLSVYIDLSEVTLVDRKTVQYFSERVSEGMKLVNCPIYLKRWIPQRSEETES